MGGRGSDSGSLRSIATQQTTQHRWTSKDQTTYKDEGEYIFSAVKQDVQSTEQMSFRPEKNNNVFVATSKGNGEISLSPDVTNEYRTAKDGNVYGVHKIQSGISNLKSNEETEFRSVGINWENVKTVSGSTYYARDFLKKMGFVFDTNKKIWKKP